MAEESLGKLSFDVIADDKGSFAKIERDFEKFVQSGKMVDDAVSKMKVKLEQLNITGKDADNIINKYRKELEQVAMANIKAGESTVKLSSGFADMAKKGAIFGLGLIGVNGVVGALNMTKTAIIDTVVEMAKFEKSMAEVGTLVDTSKVDIKSLGESVKALSMEYGVSKTSLSSALYEVVSAGVEAGDAIDFLRVATEASIGGVTDTKTVVDGLTSALNAYGMSADKARDVSDSLFIAVKVGKTRWDELAPTIGQVASISNAAGVSLDELNSAIATLTLNGLSTAEAGTAMRGMLTALIDPSDEARKYASALGLEFNTAAVKAKGFAGFLKELSEKTGGSEVALAKLFPEVRGMNGAVQLTTTGMQRFNSTLDEMRNKAGTTQVAYGKMTETLSFKWDQAREGVKGLANEFTVSLTPALGASLEFINEIISGAKWMIEQGNRGQTLKNLINMEETAKGLKEWSDQLRLAKDALIEFESAKGYKKGKVALNYGFKSAEEFEDQIRFTVKHSQFVVTELLRQKAASKELEEQNKKTTTAEEERRIAAAKKAEEVANSMKKELDAKKEATEIQQKIDDQILSSLQKEGSIKNELREEQLKREQDHIDTKMKWSNEVYEHEIENLQAIVEDEDKSIEERKNASLTLVETKRKQIEENFKYSVEKIKAEGNLEKQQYQEKIEALGEYYKELVQKRDQAIKEVKNSDLTQMEKDRAIKQIEFETSERLKGIERVQDGYYKMIDEVEVKSRASIKQTTTKSMENLKDLANTKLKQDIELNINSKVMADSVKKWSSDVESAMGLAIQAFNVKSGEEVVAFTKKLGATISSIGEKTNQSWMIAGGGILGTAASIFGVLDQQFDITGQQARENQLAMREMMDTIYQGVAKIRQETAKWLKQMGVEDWSLYTYDELEAKKSEIRDKRTDNFGKLTGLDTSNYTDGALDNASRLLGSISGKNVSDFTYSGLSSLAGLRNSSQKWDTAAFLSRVAGAAREHNLDLKSIENLLYGMNKDGNLDTSEQEVEALAKIIFGLKGKVDKKTGSIGFEYAQNVSNLMLNDKEYQPLIDEISEVQKDLLDYDTIPTLSISALDKKKSFKAVKGSLDRLRSYEKVSDLEYWTLLQKYARKFPRQVLEDEKTMIEIELGKASTRSVSPISINRTYPDVNFSIPQDSLDPHVSSPTETPPLNLSNLPDDILTLGNGGIATKPTFALIAEKNEPEAVIPLSKLFGMIDQDLAARNQNMNFNVTLQIDPNIPITRDTARVMGDRLSEMVINSARAKGMRL